MKYNVNKDTLFKAVDFCLQMVEQVHPAYYPELLEQVLVAKKNKQYDKLVDMFKDPLFFPMKPGQEPGEAELTARVNQEGIILTEKFYIRHLTSDGTSVITEKKVTCLPVEIRRAQQLSMKENITAESSDVRNISGQVTGSSKSGSFSAPQMATIIANSPNPNKSPILTELMSVASDDMNAKTQANDQIYNNGEYSLKDIKKESEGDRSSLVLMDGYYNLMGIQTDLLEPLPPK